jgi:hypothetical protein
MFSFCRLFCLLMFIYLSVAFSFAQDSRTFKVFQFPPNKIPSIDGKANDWDLVGEEYVVGMDQLTDTRASGAHKVHNPKDLDVKVKVGWVKGMNRLYFLYEAYDNYWDFSLPDLHNDIFELVVDGDRSGGPFISPFHVFKDLDPMEAYFSFQGTHAQNYHIYTPAVGKEWAFVWGSQSWIKNLPYANAASDYKFTPGDSGKFTLEFWITPFDYAGHEGPSRAIESVMTENKTIGLSWAVIDYDNVNTIGNHNNNGFWTLGKERKMYGDASFLRPFRLMPLESKFLKPIDAKWSFSVIDMSRRLVSFKDESIGEITSWKWDFGDGETSSEQHPIHVYDKQGMYVVVLWVEGPSGKSRMAKVWDVAVK